MTKNKLEEFEKIETKLKVKEALDTKKEEKQLSEAAPYDLDLAKKQAKLQAVRERKQKAFELYDRVEAGQAQIVEKGKRLELRPETISEFVNTGLIALAVLLGKKPAKEALQFSLKSSCEKMASGLNKCFPELAAGLEGGSGYADLAVGVAGIGKEVWETVTAEPVKSEEGESERDTKKA